MQGAVCDPIYIYVAQCYVMLCSVGVQVVIVLPRSISPQSYGIGISVVQVVPVFNLIGIGRLGLDYLEISMDSDE